MDADVHVAEEDVLCFMSTSIKGLLLSVLPSSLSPRLLSQADRRSREYLRSHLPGARS